MKVPLHIKRIAAAGPARAFLLPGHDGAALLQLCTRLRPGPPPDVFTVADGYLVRPHGVIEQPVVGAVRLAELGTNLFLPVDAELLPALLPDEAAALGRKNGLIFLPHGRVLEFDPASPLPWSAFLQPAGRLESNWQPLPPRRELAETLSEITLADQGASPEDLLSAGGEGIGEEQPRPGDASLPQKMLGHMAGGVGQGLAWLGRMLHMEGLARAGARAMDFGMSMFPRLSEKLLGRQEASLRELLREFREGDVEKALRRALPLTNEPKRGSTVHDNANLPTHDVRYSLGNILGAGGAGSSIWFTNVDVYAELRQQYRAQAEAATKRGDFRRAAFIYGKLLGEYALAADVLSRGGLHHDAAQIYLKALHNFLAAAREFELAGDVDRALQLYRQQGERVRAGDLLRRMGEEELAVAEYRQAADLLVAVGNRWNQAGELMLQKAQRPDLARHYFEKGWAERPGGVSFLDCGRNLLDLHAGSGDCPALLALVGEAEECFRVPGNDSGTNVFFNHAAHLAERSALAEVRDELTDRSLMMLAQKVREGAADPSRASNLVPVMFPSGGAWQANQVTDAEFALRSAQRQARQKRSAHPACSRVTIDGVVSVVRAVCQSPVTEEIFIGFENGTIACCDPKSDKVTLLEKLLAPVHQLIGSDDAAQLIVLSGYADGIFHLDGYEREVCWTRRNSRNLGGIVGLPWIMHTLGVGAKGVVGVWREEVGMQLLSSKTLLPLATLDISTVFQRPLLAFLLPTVPPTSPGLVIFDGQEMWHCANIDVLHFEYPKICSIALHPTGSTLSLPNVHCVMREGESQLVALSPGGTVAWIQLWHKESQLSEFVTRHLAGSFTAAALVRPGLIVAVDRQGLVGLRAGEAGLKEIARQPLELEWTVACFVCHAAKETIVVGDRGTLTKVRWLPPGS